MVKKASKECILIVSIFHLIDYITKQIFFLNEINSLYKSYQNTREELIKEFQNKSYDISIKPYFWYDIRKSHLIFYILV